MDGRGIDTCKWQALLDSHQLLLLPSSHANPVQVELPANTTIEYKYVILEEQVRHSSAGCAARRFFSRPHVTMMAVLSIAGLVCHKSIAAAFGPIHKLIVRPCVMVMHFCSTTSDVAPMLVG